MEFNEEENIVFDEVMEVVGQYSHFQRYEIKSEPTIRFPGLEIHFDIRKVYRDRQEIHLTAKEYDLLCILVTNKGKVLTYEQIYQKVWGDFTQDIENNTIGYHICNLRKKLFSTSSNASFIIRCVREVGYCFEIIAE